MDFALAETQELLRKTARGFLTERSKPAYVRAMAEDERGYGDDFWHDVAALGWLGLLIPESYGGAGLSLSDMAVLLEEWGAAVAPGPLVESAVIGSLALSMFGTDRQKVEWLPQIASGDAVLVPALYEDGGGWSASPSSVVASQVARVPHPDPLPVGEGTASRVAGGWSLSGSKTFVTYANTAKAMIVSAAVGSAGGAPGLFIVPTSAEHVAPTRLQSASGVPTYRVDFEDTVVAESQRLGGHEDGAHVISRLLHIGAAARAVQMAGAARRVLEMTVQYVSARQQFGKPIGAYQAIQHKCAEMASSLQGARLAAYRAAYALGEGRPAGREVAIAKIAMNEALPRICSVAHQCHGAIGFTWEHDLHLFTRRSVAWRAEYGDTVAHREALAVEMGI